MKLSFVSIALIFAFIFCRPLHSSGQEEDSLLVILQDELNREFKELQLKEVPPYYMEFRADDLYSFALISNLGCLVEETNRHDRNFNAALRIGDYSFDNTHSSKDPFEFQLRLANNTHLPLDDNRDAIAYRIWENNRSIYRSAYKVYRDKLEKSDRDTVDDVGDFTREAMTKYFEPANTKDLQTLDLASWKERINHYTKLFDETTGFIAAIAEFSYSHNRKYFVNTEGSSVVQNQNFCQLSIFVIFRNANNELIPYVSSFTALDPDKMPSDETIVRRLEEIRETVYALDKAPKGDPYTGPAILAGETAGVCFHEVFGHRLEAHRFNSAMDSRTFQNKIGERVIDECLTIVSDPTIKTFGDKDLVGYYAFDDQGVKAQKVINVDQGILTDFLLSRKPVKGFDQSNGHGRGNLGQSPVARQSNLVISTSEPESMEQLRKALIKECKKQKLDYGYFFQEVSGGFTNTMNYMPDFFNIVPLEVYKIYTDGRPDELVRGVNLIGTPMIMFSEIIATGDQAEVFSGICGAESGSVPVSTISPAILVRKIETQNQFSFDIDWPILPNPKIAAHDEDY